MKIQVGDRVTTCDPMNGPNGVSGEVEWVRPEGEPDYSQSTFDYWVALDDVPGYTVGYYEGDLIPEVRA